jgi:hypothetical protein
MVSQQSPAVQQPAGSGMSEQMIHQTMSPVDPSNPPQMAVQSPQLAGQQMPVQQQMTPQQSLPMQQVSAQQQMPMQQQIAVQTHVSSSPVFESVRPKIGTRARTRLCSSKACRQPIEVRLNICNHCSEVQGRPVVERLLWYFLVGFFAIHAVIVSAGLRPPFALLLLASLIMTVLTYFAVTILYAESPLWILRGLVQLFSPATLRREGGWFRSQVLRWAVRILSVLLCFALLGQITILLLTLFMGISPSVANSFEELVTLFTLPTFSFLIGFVEFMFLYELPSSSRLFRTFARSPARLRLWRGTVIFIVGLMILSWTFASNLLPGIPSAFFLLVLQPLLLLLAIRELPQKLKSESRRERNRVVIPLYLMVLLTFPVIFSLALYSSGLESLEIRSNIQMSKLGVHIAYEDIAGLNSLITNMVVFAEMAGVAWAMWIIWRSSGDDSGLRRRINSTHVIAIALTGLLVIPLAWASLSLSVSRQQITLYSTPEYIGVAISLFDIEDQVVVELIVPEAYSFTGEVGGWNGNAETRLELVGGINSQNETYRSLPVSDYFYGMAPCPLNENENLSLYRLHPSGMNDTFPLYHLPYTSAAGQEMTRLMVILIMDDEVVTWNSAVGSPGSSCS